MKKVYNYIFIFLVLFIFSCINKEIYPEITASGKGTFAMQVIGSKTWNERQGFNGPNAYYDSTNNLIGITVVNEEKSSFELYATIDTVKLEGNIIKVPKPYFGINVLFIDYNMGLLSGKTRLNLNNSYLKDSTKLFHFDSISPNKIKYYAFNSKYVSGVFNLTLKNKHDSSLTITNGIFDLKFKRIF